MSGERAQNDVYRVFSYITAPNAASYLAIVEVLMEAKDRFRLQLRPADVRRALPAAVGLSEDEVRDALESLDGWGVVRHFYDSAAPDSLVDFYAKRHLYQLTPEGIAAHAGVRAALAAGADRGGRLSSVLLPEIVERLRALAAEASELEPDPAKLYQTFRELFATFTELADNAGRYMDDLAVETAELAADDERFLAYKTAVLVYLDTFIASFAATVPTVMALLGELDPIVRRVLPLAAAADAAPTIDGDDAGPVELLTTRWEGVHGWFVAPRGSTAVADGLREAMVEALTRIVSAVRRLNDRHLRRASREADFSRLAEWFARIEPENGEQAAWLWDAAFGSFSARHFVHPSPDEDADRRVSFWDAAPAEIAPRLRTAATRSSPGRPGQVSDYGAAKQARVEALRAARRRTAAAASRLAERTPAPLSEIGSVDADEFALLLDLVAAALNSPTSAGRRRRASTVSAAIELRLPEDDAAPAQLRTPAGTFECPDFAIDVTAREPRRAAMARSEATA